jgi:hypothetical protein
MKHKVSELEGALLDAAVAKALGWQTGSNWCADPDRPGFFLLYGEPDEDSEGPHFSPSTLWQDGGPIIQREGIAIYRVQDGWSAVMPDSVNGGSGGYFGNLDYIDVNPYDGSRGPTPLIAAMRAYVASKFGGEVELP